MKNQNQAPKKSSSSALRAQTKMNALSDLEAAKNTSIALLTLLDDCFQLNHSGGQWTKEHGDIMSIGIGELVGMVNFRLEDAFSGVHFAIKDATAKVSDLVRN
jgi:hypothetical protein